MGVRLHEEAHGKLFPDSNRSRDVLNALLDEVEAVGALLHSSTRVDDVTPDEPFTLRTTRGLDSGPLSRHGHRRVVAAKNGQ